MVGPDAKGKKKIYKIPSIREAKKNMETKAELNSATTKPKTTKPNRCWDGYEPVPGKSLGSRGDADLKKLDEVKTPKKPGSLAFLR